MLRLACDAEETGAGLLGLVDEATAAADAEAADTALDLVAPRTPRRSGRLAAGLRSAAVPAGFEVTDAVPYANIVNARTGFISQTLIRAEQTIADIYDRHTQARLDDVGP